MRQSKKAKKKAVDGDAGGSLLYLHRFETVGRSADEDSVVA